VSKFFKKDCVNQSSEEDKIENTREANDGGKECIVVTENNEKKELEQSDGQSDENKRNDVTPKRSSVGKNKKLDKSQQKSGALTKFFKKTDKNENTADNNDTHKSKVEQDLQATSIQKEEDEICLNENLEPSRKSNLQLDKELKVKIERFNIHDIKSFPFQSDSDVVILSSDNESSDELDKSILNKSKETQESGSVVNEETNKNAKKKLKTPTSKQLEKKEEIDRRKEEKLKLKMVRCAVDNFREFLYL